MSPRTRRVLAWVATALAGLLVLAALVAPNQSRYLTPSAFLRIPAEVVLGVLVLLLLPARLGRVVAVLAGVVLGLLTILTLFDLGFYTVLDRPFDPVLDAPLVADAVEVVSRSTGQAGAVGAVIAAAVLAIAVLALMSWAVLRLTRLATRHRLVAVRSATVVGLAWIVCALVGVQLVPGVPVASSSAATLAYDRAARIGGDLADREKFAASAGTDAFRDTPDDQLLTALRGKDVIVAFVESYGRMAVEDPQYAPQIGAMLDANDKRLATVGYAARSGWLTSPTFGGGSWYAHSTLLSGLWIDNQQRYRTLLASDRLTLNGAFRRAGWRTVGIEPADTRAWPEGKFYRYNQLYTAPDLNYRGPYFNFASIPDQYTLSVFQRAERAAPSHPPVMAEIVMLSSHTPWAPLPRFIDWDKVGDGHAYDGMPASADSRDFVWRDPARIRTAYRQSVEYSMNTLISYVQTYGGDNLVLVVLGDHQPPIITPSGASRDVPVAIVAHDRSVLDRVAGWGWQDGLKPAANGPVWRMDTFRDRFLGTFGGPAPAPAAASGPPIAPTGSPSPPAR
jgi:hypothetical protein